MLEKRYGYTEVALVAWDEEIFPRIFQLIREFERQFREQGEHDISTTQFQALAILDEVQPITAMAMAGLLRIAGPTATRALDSLDRRGLLLKERDPQDRRIVWLRLTDSGREQLQAERQRQLEWVRRLLESLGDEEQAMLAATLEKLNVQAALIP